MKKFNKNLVKNLIKIYLIDKVKYFIFILYLTKTLKN